MVIVKMQIHTPYIHMMQKTLDLSANNRLRNEINLKQMYTEIMQKSKPAKSVSIKDIQCIYIYIYCKVYSYKENNETTIRKQQNMI